MVNLIPTKFGMKIQLATAKIVGRLMWFFSKSNLDTDENAHFGCRRIGLLVNMLFSTLQFVPIAIIASMPIHLHSISYQ